jgi:type IV secretory pathway VirB2 component (pilin)
MQLQPKAAKEPTARSLPWLFALSLLFIAGSAFAATDELGGSVCKLVNLMSGKWLFGIAILSFVAGAVSLLFGAEMSDGVKKMVTIFTIIAMVLTFGSILSMAFNAFSSMSCS